MTDDPRRTPAEPAAADALLARLRALPPDLPDLPDRFERVRAARTRRRRRTAALASVVVVLLAGATGVLVRGSAARFLTPAPAAATAAATCPAVYGPDDPWVPGSPSVPAGGDRLVPQAAPQRALLCRYTPTGDGGATAGGASSTRPAVDGSVVLAGPLDPLAADLTWLPEDQHGAARSCTAMGGPTTRFLLGLTYPDGVVWVAASADPNGCEQSWNGRFATSTNLGRQLAASFDARTWIGGEAWATVDQAGDPAPAQPCSPPRSGRLGPGRELVPAGATSLLICRLADDGTPRTRRTVGPADSGRLLGMLDDLRTSAWDSGCRPLDPDGPRGTSYVLRFDYPQGPPVVVRVEPSCRPAVTSRDRAVDDAGRLVPEIERLLVAG